MSKLLVKKSVVALKATLLLAGVLSLSMAKADTLRFCSDPDNLPFSKSEGAEKGLYIDLADLVAKRLDSSVEYVWWLSYNQRRAIRNTMDSCDAYFALPASADYKVRGLEKSHSFLNVGYAVVSENSFSFAALGDLKGKRIGVLHGSPPHVLLSTQEGYQPKNYLNQDEIFAALVAGEVDAGILWGPSAGFDNQKKFQGRWKITPVSGQGLNGQVAVAVSKNKPELKEKINQALTELEPEIKQLQAKYGFPQAAPIALEAKASWSAVSESVALGLEQAPMDHAAAVLPKHAVAQQSDLSANMIKVANDVSEAQASFNSKCSHCHGQNGASPQSERDLRKLTMRYKEPWRDVAYTTITKGRPEMGMPTWGGVLPDEEITAIIKFLETIQKN
jgi:ABC-type amino acid transport substrate-binding protein/cytochrome c5